MAWTIEFDSDVQKDLKRLDHQTRTRLVKFLSTRVAPSTNPRAWGKPLRGKLAGLWRYRVGDYRIICQIIDHEIKVLVITVAHRKEVYH